MAIAAIEKELIEKINESIFGDLEEIVKKLNKRFNLKFYSVIFDEQGNYQYCLRVRKTLSKDHKVNQEELYSIENIFKELNLGNDYHDKFKSEENVFKKDIKAYLDKRTYVRQISELLENEKLDKASKEAEKAMDEIAGVKNSSNDIVYQVLYSNFFQININSKKYNMTYVIEIRNADEETMDLFYKNPLYSFLRMVLDNFFYDYYELESDTHLKLDEEENINKKYNENTATFLRRMSRVFFGKIQSILNEEIKSDFEKVSVEDKEKIREDIDESFDNKIDSRYYIFNLLEEIEDISNRTYEGANPFGSILFLSKGFIDENNKKIKYAVKFKKKDRIKLGDSKRIRKLLEITNCEKELYLIANDHEILGVGEVGWNELSEYDALIRLDFKGLSKYNLVYVYTKIKDYASGNLVLEDNKKIYKCEKNLEIVENNLLTIIFKNPKVKEEEYSPEKFKRIFQAQFGGKEIQEEEKKDLNKSLEKIERVVRKAREQKHGTMVVITEDETAKNELIALGAQSTLIEPREIEAEYVKYLTSIDGAIYFDTKGQCHAIGVILDGITNEKIGDASRGARYNSAYKYLEKLKNQNKDKGQDNNPKCVIVIVSEDGMVDIIPDLENEDKIQNIVQEIIYSINEEDSEKENKLEEYEEELKGYKNAIEHYLYFEIAEAFYNKEKHEKALEYYDKGFEEAEDNSIIISEHYNLRGNCCYYMETEPRYKESIHYYNEAIKRSNSLNDTRIYYANIGNSYFELGQLYKDKKKVEEKECYEKAIEYYNEYVKISKKNNFVIESSYYNMKGVSNTYIGFIEMNKENKNNYFRKAIEEYKKAIDIKKERVYYWNRGLRYEDLFMYKRALEDFTSAVILNHEDEKSINEIKEILESHDELAVEVFEFYKKQCKENNIDGIKALEKILEEYTAKASHNNENTSTDEAPDNKE